MSARPALERIARGLPPAPAVPGQLEITLSVATGGLLDAMWGADFRPEFAADLAAAASTLAGRPVRVVFAAADPPADPPAPTPEEPA